MERERGSDVEHVEIFGGIHDGAVGLVVGREEADGKLLTHVRLPDGTVITLASDLVQEDDLPRETGS